jgi:hypothetical protein
LIGFFAMIGLSEISSLISRIFYNDVKNAGRIQQQVNCPRCQERDDLPEPDGKHNLEINLKRHQFRCWKCEEPRFSGSLMYLIRLLGTKEQFDEYKNFVTIYGFSQEEYVDEEKIVLAKLPPETIFFKDMISFIPDHMEAYMYLIGDGKRERKLTREFILEKNLGFCTEGKFKNRIIVPSYDRFGRVNYFVARTFKDKVKPSYLNPDADKTRVIINEKNINWDSTLYIVEGMFDLFAMPRNTTAVLGKTLSTALYNALKEYKPNVIVVFDPDAFKNMIHIYETIHHMYGPKDEHRVRFVEIQGDDDIDDIRKKQGEEKVREVLRTARYSVDNDDYFKFNNNHTYRFQYVNEPRGYGFDQLNYQ